MLLKKKKKIHALPAIIHTSFVCFDNMYPDHINLGNKTWKKKKKDSK